MRRSSEVVEIETRKRRAQEGKVEERKAGEDETDAC